MAKNIDILRVYHYIYVDTFMICENGAESITDIMLICNVKLQMGIFY